MMRFADAAAHEFRYVTRSLLRSSGFLFLGVSSLAVAIAACAISLGLVYGAYQRAPYPDAERLVEIGEFINSQCVPECIDNVQTSRLPSWRARTRTLEALGVSELVNVSLAADSADHQTLGARVDSTLLGLLNLRPVLGRSLQPSDFVDAAEPTVVISHRLWTALFGRNVAVLARTIMLNGVAFAIVGVAAPEFRYPARADVWLPLSAAGWRAQRTVVVLGRLRPGTSAAESEAELRTLSAAEATGRWQSVPDTRLATVKPLGWAAQLESRRIWPLLVTVAALLAIASANLYALVLARGMSRQRLTAIMIALGVPRSALARHAAIEGLLLGSVAGAMGILLAVWARPLAEWTVERTLAFPLPVSLDESLMALAAVLGVAIGVGASVVSRALLNRSGLQPVLQSTPFATPDRRGQILRRGLVVVEIAATMTLVTAAVALASAHARVRTFDVGFDTKHLLLGRLALPAERAASEQGALIADAVQQALASHVGVSDAGVWSESYPRNAGADGTPAERLLVEGRLDRLPLGAVPPIEYQVEPSFFRVLGLRAVAGRLLDRTDALGSEPVVVVNEEAARRYWPSTSAIGKRLKLPASDSSAQWLTVVGVVPNTHTIGAQGVVGALQNPGYFPLTFRPIAQTVWSGRDRQVRVLRFLARTADAPSVLIRSLRSRFGEVDPGLRILQLESLRHAATTYGALAVLDLSTRTVGAFSLFALALAGLAIYSLVADSVARRGREIAIRVALGATSGKVLALVHGEGLQLSLVGIAFGTLASIAVTRALSSVVFGLSGISLVTCLSSALILLAAAGAACYFPARSALRLDPVSALKTE